MSIGSFFGKKKEAKIEPKLPSQAQPGRTYTPPPGTGPERNHVYNMNREWDASKYLVDLTGYSWDDVIGMEDMKEDLQDVVALLSPDVSTREAMDHWGLKCPRGMLMYGPPGCGKTHIAKALASQCKARFYLINGPEIMDRHVGEAAKRLRAIYKAAEQYKPSIIFIDEMDSITISRSMAQTQAAQEVITTLLGLMDGLKELDGVFTIGATNCPEMIDSALLRPGRLNRGVFVGVPTPETRRSIFRQYMKDKPLADDVDLDELVDRTEGYSIADIVGMVNKASTIAWRNSGRKSVGTITHTDLMNAHDRTRTSISTDKLISYHRWRENAFS